MGLIFDIKRYAINDGPGIRTTVFMKGCPLSCVWCHNPEGVSSRKQKLYTKKKCIGCRTCMENCPQKALALTPEGIVTDNALCNLCGKCAEVCPALAMEISGTEYSVDYLMKEIEKETVFMDRSEGGVTFAEGSRCCIRICCWNYFAVVVTWVSIVPLIRHCLPERRSSGEVMQHSELFLVDLKHMDTVKHKLYCGVSNELILSNLRMVAEAGHAFHIRIPLIEGVNADEEKYNPFGRIPFLLTLAVSNGESAPLS